MYNGIFSLFLIAYIHRVCLEHIDFPVDFSAFICPIILSTTLMDFSMRVSKNYIWTEEFSGFWLVAFRKHIACMHACSVTQLCLTLSDTMDCSRPSSSVHGVFQAWILEWLPFHPLGDLPDPGVRPASPMSLDWQVASLPWATWEAQTCRLDSFKCFRPSVG